MRKQHCLHLILLSFLVHTARQSTSMATSVPTAEHTSPPRAALDTPPPAVEAHDELSGYSSL
jgi:hypothetical protein